MSNDLKHRDSPPDFGDDDNKDDDQMFKSASLPVTDDVPLSGDDNDEDEDDDDDDDDNPFGEVREKKKTSLTIPPVTPIAVPEPQPPTPVKQESHLFSTDSNINSAERNTSITQPVHSTPLYENQFSASKSLSNENTNLTTNVKPIQKRSDIHNIEITISDPTKVGEVFILNKIFRFFIDLFRVYHHI
jgi:hypothetical protein